ncbi:MAG TPA: TSUP family transporter [Steroidobacteraceae bacterium]|nr:TSUP family transporter [Steroidobacteraceae bacterium]
MTFETTFVLAAAFGAGFIDAMAGGGGLVQLPALFAAYPNAPHTTLLGTGKLAGLAGTSSAIARFIRHVRIDWALVLPAAAGAFLASLAGAWIATVISPERFRTLVPALLAVVLAYTLLHRDLGREHRPRNHGRHGRWLAAASAGAIGLYDGFFGPGTGSFLVFLFVRVFGLDFLHASASAKIVNASTNVAAIILFGLTGELYWLLGLAMSACNVAGAQFGSHLAIRRGSGLVRKVFLAVVGSLIAKTAWDALRLHL